MSVFDFEEWRKRRSPPPDGTDHELIAEDLNLIMGTPGWTQLLERFTMLMLSDPDTIAEGDRHPSSWPGIELKARRECKGALTFTARRLVVDARKRFPGLAGRQLDDKDVHYILTVMFDQTITIEEKLREVIQERSKQRPGDDDPAN